MTREEAITYGERKNTRIQEKLCRYGSSYGDHSIYYSEMEFTSAALSALREQQERRWIPVTDRLPEIGRKCLIANREIVVRGWLRPDGVWKTGVSSDEIWSKFSLYPPTHWMPMPEPPKEE